MFDRQALCVKRGNAASTRFFLPTGASFVFGSLRARRLARKRPEFPLVDTLSAARLVCEGSKLPADPALARDRVRHPDGGLDSASASVRHRPPAPRVSSARQPASRTAMARAYMPERQG